MEESTRKDVIRDGCGDQARNFLLHAFGEVRAEREEAEDVPQNAKQSYEVEDHAREAGGGIWRVVGTWRGQRTHIKAAPVS